MKEITLTRGLVATVDDIDYDRISWAKWYAVKSYNTYYAQRTIKVNGKKCTIYMHREIMNAPPGMEVDHKDGNGLKNTRGNLVISTHRQNLQNQHRATKTSRFPGVYWARWNGKWRAMLRVKRKGKHIGYFLSESDAYEAYCRAVKEVERRGVF